jgi:hypothetical protein
MTLFDLAPGGIRHFHALNKNALCVLRTNTADLPAARRELVNGADPTDASCSAQLISCTVFIDTEEKT